MVRKSKRQRIKPPSYLPSIKAESKALGVQIAALMAAKRDLDAVIARFEGKAPAPSVQRVIPGHRPLSKNSPFYGLALPEAVAKQLSTHTDALTASQIWDEMEGNFPTNSKDPVHAVQWALQRRARLVGDVMLVGAGKWAMSALYSDEDKKRIKASLGPMAARDRETHIAKTKAGAANVKARGGKWGAPLKVNAEVIAKVNNALAAGTTIKDACELAGISVGSYYNKRALFESAQQEPGAMN